jgi:hypothetical protein
MATIVIKDLPENMDLDREAMLAITGGARLGGRSAGRARRVASPPAGSRAESPEARRRPVPSTLFK